MKFPIERIPKEDIPEEVWAVLRPVRVVLYFCIAQTILMISIATFLDYKKAISNWMFNNLYFLVDYIPVLWKYKQIFAVLNRTFHLSDA
jgi:hypothetical protein